MNSISSTHQTYSESVLKTLRQAYMLVGLIMVANLITAVTYLSMGWSFPPMIVGLVFMVVAFLTGMNANKPSALAWVFLFSISSGLLIGTVLDYYLQLQNGVSLIANAALGTASIVIGMTLYATLSGKSFSRWAGLMTGATIALIVMSLANYFFFGSSAMHMFLSYAAVLIFAVWLLIDTSRVLQGEETNYVSAAVGFYISILNIFLSLLSILRGND